MAAVFWCCGVCVLVSRLIAVVGCDGKRCSTEILLVFVFHPLLCMRYRKESGARVCERCQKLVRRCSGVCLRAMTTAPTGGVSAVASVVVVVRFSEEAGDFVVLCTMFLCAWFASFFSVLVTEQFWIFF